ncbi:YeeE/YedE thiosulfate transporter family protein [Sinorhizobium sp. BJ1]|uniref:YeeE/YedE thiosulfate transporter family protein n=1 Tax=Sinorhizobium sp. BJ1 TaxID=2035455 RepID=UPI001FDF0A72|nr:YeeE/YedE thiosulfate transporter family protein [Sinorhizobium sp. BJ1]
MRQEYFVDAFARPQTPLERTLAGILMGLGALLIPGGNDTLLLVGFPAGAWQAALAYLLFVSTLALLIVKIGSIAKAWS